MRVFNPATALLTGAVTTYALTVDVNNTGLLGSSLAPNQAADLFQFPCKTQQKQLQSRSLDSILVKRAEIRPEYSPMQLTP